MTLGSVDLACSTCSEEIMETKVTRERLITFLLETPMFEKLDPSEIQEIIHIVEVEQYQAYRPGYRQPFSIRLFYIHSIQR